MRTKECWQCHEQKPIGDFRRSSGGRHKRITTCNDCVAYTGGGGPRGYIDDDAKESTPAMSSNRLARLHGLNIRERRIVGLAAAKVIEYRTRDRSRVGPLGWQGESAEDVVDRMMPDATAREKYHVLTAALAKADEMVGEAREDAA